MNQICDTQVSNGSHLDPRLMSVVDEISDRIQNGKSVDIEAYVTDLPSHGDYLRQLVRTLQDVADLGKTAAHASQNGDVGLQEKRIGEFRLIRQIGHGGMGLVFEAEQESLDRRVALKVLQLGGILDDRQLARFKNEARAAATLHHPHIVPVFAVGSDRGIHYYAMQYIDGPSLAEILHELKAAPNSPADGQQSEDDISGSSSNISAETKAELQAAIATKRAHESGSYVRKVANWGVQASDGLAYAHENGVLHRDIKPGNLLVDRSGKLWITDFGLARMERDASMTITGDLMGTIRYMSPEQALAKRVLVDQRSDVYSLGVTLYEMLTFQPAFAGQDRQELLKQIAFEEPKPLRSINPSIPVELETIVLKAAAKNPEERYLSAQELADDLQRFLDHEPIRAKPPTLWQRSAKWARRHRAIVTAAICTAAATFLVGAIVVRQAYNREKTQRVLAERSAIRADQTLKVAIKAVDDMYTEVSDRWLSSTPQMQKVRREVLKNALTFFQELAMHNTTDPVLEHEIAKSWRRIGQIHHMFNDNSTSIDALKKAIHSFTQLADRFSRVPKHRHELALTYNYLTKPLDVTGQYEQAEPAARKAVAIQQQLVHEYPQELKYRSALADIHHNLGHTLTALGRADEALVAHSTAISIYESLRKEDPDELHYLRQLGHAYDHLGHLWRESGKMDAAEQMNEAALELLHNGQAGTLKDDSVVDSQAYLLSLAYQHLGDLNRDAEKYDESEDAYYRALALAQSLCRDFPDVVHYQFSLLRIYTSFASTLQAADKSEQARKLLQEALPIAEKLAREYPDLNAREQQELLTRVREGLAN